MSLFSCCPKKPKKSLDYVIKWVEDTDKTIEELNSTIEALETWKETIDDNISELVRQAIEDYDWSELPVDALQAKADKVENAVAGNLASLDSEGNLLDSGKKPSDFVPNVSGAIEGNFASLDAEGNLQDSGITSNLFGLKLTFVRDENGDYAIDSNLKQELNELLTLIPVRNCVPCAVQAQWWNEDLQNYSSAEYPGAVCITRVIGPRIYTTVYISFAGNYYYATRSNVNDFPNTWTKFENPFAIDPAFNVAPVKSTDSTPIYDNNRLITSGAVKSILSDKADKVVGATTGNLASLDEEGNLQDSGNKASDFAPTNHGHDLIEESEHGLSKVEATEDAQEGCIKITLKDNSASPTPETATIDLDNIDNLKRALEDPVNALDPQSEYSDSKLITAAAVLNQCSSKLDKPITNLTVKFNVSGGTLTILDDTTEYDEIFDLVAPGFTTWHSMFVSIYNSDDDVYTPFFGVASVSGQYSNVGDGTLLEIYVTIYVGGYTIHLNKNISSGTIAVSMDSFEALLQNS